MAFVMNLLRGRANVDCPEIPNSLPAVDFFMSEVLSDCKLVCEDKEFPVHRVILACISSVFKNIFLRGEKSYNEDGYIEIEDTEPPVLKEMLHFIYTGRLTTRSMDEMMWVKLFKTAGTYAIGDLKAECATAIVANISVDNALETYILGDTYNEPILMEKALIIIKRDKQKCIPDKLTHQEVTERCPRLAYELFLP